MTPAFLGLGSNLGDRARYLAEGVRKLRALEGVQVTALSPVYETKPVGRVDQPDFLNLVVAIETELPPTLLLASCLAIENALGRKHDLRWGPRTIDIDVLLYGNLTLPGPELILPHPRLHERAFVLVPLAVLAPELTVAGRSVRDLAAAADRTGVRRCQEIRLGG